MHPKEAYKQKTGTGRLSYLSLVDAELHIGVDFSDSAAVNALIADPRYFPVVLYPAPGAFFSGDPEFRTGLGDRRLVVFVIDATWALSRQIMNRSTNLHGLPKLSFRNEYRSEFRIKEQPRDAYLSTIESTYGLIEEMKQTGLVDPSVRQEGLMDVFRRMVDYQVAHVKKGAVRF
jgi:DTW domain-containing protein